MKMKHKNYNLLSPIQMGHGDGTWKCWLSSAWQDPQWILMSYGFLDMWQENELQMLKERVFQWSKDDRTVAESEGAL